MKTLMKFLMGVVIFPMFTLYSCGDTEDEKMLDVIEDVASIKEKFVDKVWFLTREVKTAVDMKDNFIIKETTNDGENKEDGKNVNFYQIIKFNTSDNGHYLATSYRDDSGNYSFHLSTRSPNSWSIIGNAIRVKLLDPGTQEYNFKDFHVKEATGKKLVLYWLSKENEFKAGSDFLRPSATEEGRNNLDKLLKKGSMYSTQTYILVTLNESGDIIKQY